MKSDSMGGCFLFGNFFLPGENTEGGWVCFQLDSVGSGIKDKCIAEGGGVKKCLHTTPYK